MNDPHWIIHLPTTFTRADEAAALAVALRRSLGHVLAIDFGETTLSEADRQHLRTPVWCDHRLPVAPAALVAPTTPVAARRTVPRRRYDTTSLRVKRQKARPQNSVA